jgi:hypothetical protein
MVSDIYRHVVRKQVECRNSKYITLLSMKTTEQVATGREKQREMCRMLICYQNKGVCENILQDMPVSVSKDWAFS